MGLLDAVTNLDTISKATSLSNLLLVNPQKNAGIQAIANPVNIPYAPPKKLTEDQEAFLFHYETENTVNLESDITDHFVEDNTGIADNIALRPEIITTQGFVGELTDVIQDFGIDNITAVAQQKLSVLSAFAPAFTSAATKAMNKAAQTYSAASSIANSAVSKYTSIKENGLSGLLNDYSKNRQQKAFLLFYGYWKDKRLFKVQTPWMIFPNCAIKSLRAIQDESTGTVTGFDVTFKVIRFAKTITTAGMTVGDARNAVQRAALTVNPSQNGSPGPSVSDLNLIKRAG